MKGYSSLPKSEIIKKIKTLVTKDPIKGEDTCIVCMEGNVKLLAFIPCGHRVCCSICCLKINKCPLCSTNFTDTLNVY